MYRLFLNILLLWGIFVTTLSGAPRSVSLLRDGWRFTREDNALFSQPELDDRSWESVTVPHDWAIYGPFDANNDKQFMAIEQDGQKEAQNQSGRTGGLPFVGTGWYRLRFEAPDFESGKKAILVFDGAMSHAQVFVNGQKAGYCRMVITVFILM